MFNFKTPIRHNYNLKAKWEELTSTINLEQFFKLKESSNYSVKGNYEVDDFYYPISFEFYQYDDSSFYSCFINGYLYMKLYLYSFNKEEQIYSIIKDYFTPSISVNTNSIEEFTGFNNVNELIDKVYTSSFIKLRGVNCFKIYNVSKNLPSYMKKVDAVIDLDNLSIKINIYDHDDEIIYKIDFTYYNVNNTFSNQVENNIKDILIEDYMRYYNTLIELPNLPSEIEQDINNRLEQLNNLNFDYNLVDNYYQTILYLCEQYPFYFTNPFSYN